jgi:diacylglycerol kinase family enzyme
MAIHGGGVWSISALAQITGYTRAAVRVVLKRNVHLGMIDRREGGYALNSAGLGLLTRVHRETLEISTGRQVGYSADLLEWFHRVNTNKPRPEAETISFPTISVEK